MFVEPQQQLTMSMFASKADLDAEQKKKQEEAKLKCKYISLHMRKRYCVRMPERAGGQVAYFSIDESRGRLEGKKKAFKEATAWRDMQLARHGQPLVQRTKEDAGVYAYNAGKGGQFAVAVWQYEDKQVKRMFSFNFYGEEMAMTLAHVARDIGTLVESDRLASL